MNESMIFCMWRLYTLPLLLESWRLSKCLMAVHGRPPGSTSSWSPSLLSLWLAFKGFSHLCTADRMWELRSSEMSWRSRRNFSSVDSHYNKVVLCVDALNAACWTAGAAVSCAKSIKRSWFGYFSCTSCISNTSTKLRSKIHSLFVSEN